MHLLIIVNKYWRAIGRA